MSETGRDTGGDDLAGGCECGRLALWALLSAVYLPLGALAFGNGGRFDLGGMAIAALLGAGLIALSVEDIRRFRLPDALTLGLSAAGLAQAASHGQDELWWSAMSAVAGYASLLAIAALYEMLRKEPGLGRGDAKLLAASGSWVGAWALPSVVLIAVGAALIACLVLMLSGRHIGWRTVLPLGPFLALATWIVWLHGPIDLVVPS